MARKQGQSCSLALIDDPCLSRFNDLRSGNCVHEGAFSGREVNLVACDKQIDISERLLLADSMSAKNHIANMPGHRSSWPVAHTFVKGRQSGALVDGLRE